VYPPIVAPIKPKTFVTSDRRPRPQIATGEL
jgi:hypothetical protein